jgi:leucyl-tRNA synthetase
MFMGPLEMVKPWNTKGVEGVYRFLGRVWRLFVDEESQVALEQAETAGESADAESLLSKLKLRSIVKDTEPTSDQLKTLHACIKKVTEDLEGMRFNTAISAMMVFINEAMNWQSCPVSVAREFLILLNPFAPHIAEELWERVHSSIGLPRPALSYATWPAFDEQYLAEDTIEIPVQVNGKLREVIKVPKGSPRESLEEAALSAPKVQPFLEGKTVRKKIVVPGKLVNLVVG